MGAVLGAGQVMSYRPGTRPVRMVFCIGRFRCWPWGDVGPRMNGWDRMSENVMDVYSIVKLRKPVGHPADSFSRPGFVLYQCVKDKGNLRGCALRVCLCVRGASLTLQCLIPVFVSTEL